MGPGPSEARLQGPRGGGSGPPGSQWVGSGGPGAGPRDASGAPRAAPAAGLPPEASLCAGASREPRSAGSRRSRRAGVSVSGANFRRSEVARRIGAMSGDSSGRRSEGRGRGRDPHRDRTRSRSRSPLSPVSRRGAASERREAPERPSLEDTEPSDSGDEMLDPASLEAETDHGLCRQIRHQYRALINSVQRKAGRGRGQVQDAGPRGPPGQLRRGRPRAARRRLDWLAGQPRAVAWSKLRDLG